MLAPNDGAAAPLTTLEPKRAVIIGGGFSGTLMAVNLVRYEGPRAVLIERNIEVGKGLAYSTAHDAHLLNVRASNMSAFPDQPEHFVRWLSERGWPASNAFVPRALYGEYLSDLLERARRAAPDRVRIVRDEAIGITSSAHGPDRIRVKLRSGETVSADTAILALGNLPPLPPDGLDPEKLGECYLADPWSPDLICGQSDDDILVIGTGLTMVDVALLLEEHGFSGRLTAISRRGLIPRVHGEGGPHAKRLMERPRGEVSELLRSVRARAETVGWQNAIDELRPFTQAMWLAASEQQKKRFLRHLRPWWDVHRHRLAPVVAERLQHLRASGRLQVIAGLPKLFRPRGDKVEVHWLTRGSTQTGSGMFSRVINCTGPQSDLTRSNDPLLRDLVAKGLARPDQLGLGLAVNEEGRLLDSREQPSRLYALGPMTRGTFWEITAVPDIRKQVWEIARRLSNAHWVEGTGL